MAVITTTIASTPRRNPFINPYGDLVSWNSPIPSAELFFAEVATILTAGAVGDSQRMVLNMDLPRSFGYVLVEGNFRISGVDGEDWDDNGSARVATEIVAPITWSSYLQCPSLFNPLGSAFGARAYRCDTINKLIVPGKTDGTLEIKVNNLNLNGSECTVDSMFRFLVFDVNQAQNYQVNTPVPTR